MENLSDIPHISYMEKPEEFWMETAEKRKPVMQAICKRIVKSFCFQFNTTPKQSDDSVFSAIIKTEHTEHSLIHATHFTH